ncbi:MULTISPECIES: hypothetical protein [Azotobacter]|uniref:hypothetical protein n=1 Tax=Azotobacter TaxID=352 RepID=UPI000921030C|nr:hypothetical protein [Azotobacter vinelandii]GLK62075.1 hypothetical protein GCM10017624_42390 [Azotobacter vinelandii]SFX20167.1 hypothetical protein SAMN04244547_00739 [Azotobacter vinelandii]
MKKRIGKPGEPASATSAPEDDGQPSVRERVEDAPGVSAARESAANGYARAALGKAKTLTAVAASGTRKIPGKVVAKVREMDANHKEVADRIDTVSMGLGITSGVVSAGAVLAAPTGLSALSVALGLSSAPLIVTAAPIVGAAAAVTGALSGGAYFYSKWKAAKERRAARDSRPPDSPDIAQ